MENNRELKKKLDQAMKRGEYKTAKNLTDQLWGENAKVVMPEGFAERITGSAQREKQKPKKRFRKAAILAAVMVVVLSLASIAYAAGLIFPQAKVDRDTTRVFTSVADTKELKAAMEYVAYLDKVKGDKAFINKAAKAKGLYPYEDQGVSYPAYLDEEKVKELSEKNGLFYSAKKTAFSSMEEIEKELRKFGLENLLSSKQKAGIKKYLEDETNDALQDNFKLGDGNITLRGTWEAKDAADSGLDYCINLAPAGSFPYMTSYDLTPAELEDAFTYTSKDGKTFQCIPSYYDGHISGYVILGTVEGQSLNIDLGRIDSDNMMDKLTAAYLKVDKKYDAIISKKLGLDGCNALSDKMEEWIEVARQKDKDALILAQNAEMAVGNDALMKKLEKKYATYSSEEKALYEAYQEESAKVYEKYGENMEKADMERFLAQMNFS